MSSNEDDDVGGVLNVSAVSAERAAANMSGDLFDDDDGGTGGEGDVVKGRLAGVKEDDIPEDGDEAGEAAGGDMWGTAFFKDDRPLTRHYRSYSASMGAISFPGRRRSLWDSKAFKDRAEVRVPLRHVCDT